jgi:CRP-like cAMP-binding protein
MHTLIDPGNDPLLASLRAAGRIERFNAGDVLFRLGDHPRFLYWVLSGELRLLRRSVDGGELLLQRCRGGPFAEASLFSAEYHCEGMAARVTEAILIPRLKLDGLLDEPEFARRYVRWLSVTLRGMRARCERLSLPRAADRVLHALAEAGELNFGAHAGSLKDWACELGMSHETLYRTLAELEKSGRIVRGDGVVTLSPVGVAPRDDPAGSPVTASSPPSCGLESRRRAQPCRRSPRQGST